MSIVPITEETDRRRDSPFDHELFPIDHFLDFAFPPFSGSFTGLGLGLGLGRRNSRIDWAETSEAHVLRASLPGFAGEDVLVGLHDDGSLQISTDSGSFSARFAIPDNARLDQMRVSMSQFGVLTVTIPKIEQADRRSSNVRVVEITGDD